ncbi:MAG: NimC/NimA family protein [Anaerofustis stercorihominis]|nr:NimC/NimA family protein [Anaerofustis stercorihominis]
MKQVYEFLKEAKTYYLATVEGDQPRVRPFGTVNIFEDKLYIQTGKVKPCSKQMAENPKVEISAMAGGRWIRIEATMVNDDRFEAKDSMLDAYPHLRKQYDPADDNTQVLYMKDATATICSFTAEPVVIKF